jgi:MscS family membrane protein
MSQISLFWVCYPILKIAAWRYFLVIFVILSAFLLREIFKRWVVKLVLSLFSRTPLRYNQHIVKALDPPAASFLIFAGVFISARIMIASEAIPDSIIEIVDIAYGASIAIILMWAICRLIRVLHVYLEEITARQHSPLHKQLVPFLTKGLTILVLLFGTMTLFSSIGIPMTSIIAGLGIGGLAVTLAAQDTLGNFFGSMMLLVDKPFTLGDRIKAGQGIDGVVERIGFRSTTIRTLPKTAVTIPNKLLAAEVIDNWSNMQKRRVDQLIGVTYSTSASQMEQLLLDMRAILHEDDGVHQDYIIARFVEFADSALNIKVLYYTKDINFSKYLEVKERVNMKFMHCVDNLGLSIAFPTRTLHIESNEPVKI